MTSATASATHIMRCLRDEIRNGHLQPEDKLGSERILSERFSTSRVTIREALKKLESEGVVYRSNRRGWFVTSPRVKYDPSCPGFFMDYVAEQGFIPFSRLLSSELVPADSYLSELFEIPEGSDVACIERVRGADNRAVYVERIFLNRDLLPEIEQYDLTLSVSKVVKGEYGQEYAANDLDIRAATLSSHQAATLSAPANFTCLNIRRIVRNAQGRVFEVDFEAWRHDTVELSLSVIDTP